MALPSIDPWGNVRWEPGTSTKITWKNRPAVRAVHSREMIILAEAEGGTPSGQIQTRSQMLRYSPSSREAVYDMLDGDTTVMEYFDRGWSPLSESIPGANYITLFRVDPSTRATWILYNDTANPSIDLTSRRYGTKTNSVRPKVETGTYIDTKKITINYGEENHIYDGIGHGLIVTYTGSGTQGTCTIATNATTDFAETVTLKVDGVVQKTISLTGLNASNSITWLASQIGAEANWVGTIPHYAYAEMPAKYLDPLTGTGVSGGYCKKITGTSTNLSNTVLTDTAKTWVVNSMIGRAVYPNSARTDFYIIISNTTNSVTVKVGSLMLANATVGNAYKIDGRLATAYLGNVIHALNRDTYVSAAKNATAIGTYFTPLRNFGYADSYATPTTPGTKPAASSSDWSAALSKVGQFFEDGGFIHSGTTNVTYQNLIKTFIITKKQLGIPFKAFIGIDPYRSSDSEETLGEYEERFKNRSSYMNSQDVILHASGFKDYDEHGTITTYGSIYTAAAMCGAACGGFMTYPLLNKRLRCEELEVNFDLESRERLIQSGCSPLKFSDEAAGNVFAQAITTYTSTTERGYRVLYPSMVGDHITNTVRKSLIQYRGQRTKPYTIEEVEDLCIIVLEDFANGTNGQEQILISNPDDPVTYPAYTVPQATITSGDLWVTIGGNTTDQIENVYIQSTFQVQNLSRTVNA